MKRLATGLLLMLVAAAVGAGTAAAEPPQCNDTVDNDGDGYVDFPEDPDCQDASDDAEAVTGHGFPATVTIRYSSRLDRFQGAVVDNRDECARDRVAVLKRVRRGQDRIMWRAATGPRGRWKSADFPRAHGKFYAVLKEKIFESNGTFLLCERDRSVTIRVRL
jgi:hypothetical protein